MNYSLAVLKINFVQKLNRASTQPKLLKQNTVVE